MFQTLGKLVKWISIPAVLIAALFVCYAGRYEPAVDFLVCFGALSLLQRAAWRKEYIGVAGLLAVAVAFSPLFLVNKIFVLMTFACIAAFITLVTAFRPQPVPAL